MAKKLLLATVAAITLATSAHAQTADVIRHFARGMRLPRARKIIAAFATAVLCAAASATAQAAERQLDLDCTVEAVVERGTHANAKDMWAHQHSVTKPEYRRITLGQNQTLTYGVGGTDPKNWTMPVVEWHNPGERGFKKWGATAQTDQPDQWGYRRWLYIGGNNDGTINNGFWTTVIYPDNTLSGALGTCAMAPGQEYKFDKPNLPNQELRDPGQTKFKDKNVWSVPFQSNHGSIYLDGTLNDTIPIRWALDTGASISHIPYDLALKLGAKPVREQRFVLADGTVQTNQVVVIRRITVADTVHVDDIEASVGATGTKPLLGKNFLDAFSSYEINNAQSLLTLRQ
jgi:predicted aspartyl protease